MSILRKETPSQSHQPFISMSCFEDDTGEKSFSPSSRDKMIAQIYKQKHR